MGQKRNWFTALIRVFTSCSKDKDKLINVSEKKNIKEKKRWGFGGSKHGEIKSFIPFYREPSSIEKILCDAEREQLHKIQEAPPKKLQPPKKATPGPVHSLAPARKLAPKQLISPNYIQMSAVKIQAAYRGYLARRSYQALKGLMRLKGVMKGHSVKRQTMNAMKCMQMLVRVQSQIHARRLQMIESRRIQQYQTPRKSEKEIESSFGKWSLTHQSEAEAHDEWNESMLTKEEVDARMRRKVEAVIKRERALAYAYSHQAPKSTYTVLTDTRNDGFPWWWCWLERNLSPASRTNFVANPVPPTPVTPSATSQPRPPSHGTPQPAFASRQRNYSATPISLRDDQSLTSCSVLMVPNYMAPTASAKAKVRILAHNREGKHRHSFGLGESIGSLQWSKEGSLVTMAKDTSSPRMAAGKHKRTLSVGGLSFDSIASLPVGVGRRLFK